jgi:branched-chain amino acid transport system substrate-binding protein
MMRIRLKFWLLAFIALSLLAGCGMDYQELAKLRQRFAAMTRGDIHIVAIEEPWSKTYINGIKLAVNAINKKPEKLLNRHVRLSIETGGDSFDEAQSTVLKIAADPSVCAVLGHRRSEVAIPASVIYEASQIIFMPPFATAKGLTGHNFKFVFRMTPNNAVMAEQLASVAQLLGYKSVALLYEQNDQNRELAFLFDDAAVERGVKLAHRRSFAKDAEDYRDIITEFSSKPIDMVFLSASTVAGARMVKQMREMGVTLPVMGGDALNAHDYNELTGMDGDNTIVPILYLQDADTHHNQRFIEEYQKAYSEAPDQNAALGYDSVRLLADAIRKAKSTTPLSMSSTLHYMPYWTGVTGVHSFDAQGDVIGKKYFFQVQRDGQWNFLPAVHIPYFLERFDHYLNMQRKNQNPPIISKSDFGKTFSSNLHPDDLRIVQLDFLHEIINFKNLGIIYSESSPGAEPEPLQSARSLGKKRGFEVRSCGVAAKDRDKSLLEQRLLNCFGQLAIISDALNISGFSNMDETLLRRVEKPLKAYKVPILSAQGDVDFGAAIKIGRFQDKKNLESNYYVNLFGSLLKDVKVYELAEGLQNMPVLAVDLKLLNEYGLLRSSALIGLAPDLYLEWLVSPQ